jgi:serine/threonine protein kinase
MTPGQTAALVAELDALVGAHINHPNIAAPIAAGLEHGVAYLAQEYAIGDSLDVVLRERGPLAIEAVAALVASLDGAIDHAARRGVSHGMLHPRDIILAPDTARITGFGIAAALSKVGATLPTRAGDAASDREALRAIVAGLKASATNEASGTNETAEPVLLPAFTSAAPVAPEDPLDREIDLGASRPAQPTRALQTTIVEPESASGRWPIVAMFLVFAVLTALSVGFFLRSPAPVPAADTTPAVDETIVELPADKPASTSAPTSPSATVDKPNAPSSVIAPSPSRPASGAVRPAQTGSVLIRSTPADADVVVNGKPRGKTPLPLRDLALGSYTIRVSRDGYAAEERTLQLTARRPTTSTTITLRSLPQKTNPDADQGVGRLTVQSRPAGARVFVNDRLAGSTPVAIPGLPAGPATVRIEKDGYVPWTATVRVSAGEQTPVRASLEGK